jgi:hypothetical protein
VGEEEGLLLITCQDPTSEIGDGSGVKQDEGGRVLVDVEGTERDLSRSSD